MRNNSRVEEGSKGKCRFGNDTSIREKEEDGKGDR